jgi:hypothetical protein
VRFYLANRNPAYRPHGHHPPMTVAALFVQGVLARFIGLAVNGYGLIGGKQHLSRGPPVSTRGRRSEGEGVPLAERFGMRRGRPETAPALKTGRVLVVLLQHHELKIFYGLHP